MSGTLYVVGTPIGNLGDLTLRAIDTLRAVDAVLAEDTRRARALLSHLAIPGKDIERFDAHADEALAARFVSRLCAGASFALVTDAGMPGISDPGALLVRAARAAAVPVVVVPGPSAVTMAVAVAGFGDGPFRFVGFLPRGGSSRSDALARIAATPEPVVLFEAPSRVRETLRDLAARTPSRGAALTRELTKRFEEATFGTLAELAARDDEPRGEITLVLAAHEVVDDAEEVTDAALDLRIADALAAGEHPKTVADRLASWSGRPKREVYARASAAKQRQKA